MNYVEKFNLLGIEARQRPCLKGKGMPTSKTEGTVGELYIDEDTGKIYKCIRELNNGKFYWEDIVGIIPDSEIGIISSEDELKEHTDGGVYTFTLKRFIEDTELSEVYEEKPGILINSFDSELRWNGSKYESSSQLTETHTLKQYIYYPSTGEIAKRTAVSTNSNARNANPTYTWDELELRTTYATKDSVPTKISDLMDDTEVAGAINCAKEAQTAYQDGKSQLIHATYATKTELAEAIGEALEGEY